MLLLECNGGSKRIGLRNTTTIDLSFPTIDYLLNDYVTVLAGDMLLPLGPTLSGYRRPVARVYPGRTERADGNLFGICSNGPGSVDGPGNATFVVPLAARHCAVTQPVVDL
jgi:hypothetical protein